MGCMPSSVIAVKEDKCKPQAEAAFLARFSLGDVLGSGAFAQVLSASDNADGTVCAVKVLSKSVAQPVAKHAKDSKRNSLKNEMEDVKTQNSLKNEVDMWQKVGTNEHSVQLYEVFYGPTRSFMTMEKCTCSVLQYFMAMRDRREEAMPQVVGQMLRGIEHIHTLRIVHRDIKGDNFLFGSDDKVKLSDFGLSAMLPSEGLLKSTSGTAPYMSPEMLKRIGYGLSTDMWSLGVTMYMLLLRDFPYSPAVKTASAMKEAIRRGDPPNFASKSKTDKGLSDSATNLIKTLLNRDAGSRLLASEALEHPFITSLPDKSLIEQEADKSLIEQEAQAFSAHAGTNSMPLKAPKPYDADAESTDVPSHPSSDCGERTTSFAL